MNSIKRAFFWLSTAGTETLERCPKWEQRKYVAFGATVLVPCAFAFIACAYALSTLTDKALVIYPVAVAWAFIILTIDRALLAGFRPFLPFWHKIFQFCMRLGIAILIGFTIAHPLVLLLFRDTIHTVIENKRTADVTTAREQFASEKESIRTSIDNLEQKIADLHVKRQETYDAKFILQSKTEYSEAIPGLTTEQQAELKTAATEAGAPFKEKLDAVNKQLEELTPQFTKTQTELTYWQSEFERELNGQRSGLVGEGPRARSIRADQLEPRREEAKRLGALMEHLTQEKAILQTQLHEAEKNAIAGFEQRMEAIRAANKAEEERVAALKHQVEQEQAGTFTVAQTAVRDAIDTQIATKNAELKTTNEELTALTNEERQKINAINAESRSDILTQTLALRQLYQSEEEGGTFAKHAYLILVLLFTLVDTIPLVTKFFAEAGPYDRLVDQDSLLASGDHKAFKKSRSRYIEDLAAGNLISTTRNKNLEYAMIDGVEHSRAAREFLDSLIELERSFAEKMHVEQETESSPEKIAALAAMKKAFYDDLHKRMETFFAQRRASSEVI